MKTRMSLRTWPVVALALAGCRSSAATTSGRCATRWWLSSERKGASEQALRRTGDGLERLIAEGGRAVCGNIGMSYTGEWECTAQQQRVKCK